MGRATLRTKAEFDRVFSQCEKFFRDGTGYYVRVAGSEAFRYGLVTPRRFGGAVERNRFRRRMRELLRRSDLPIGVEVVITAYKPYDGLSFESLRSTVEWALGRVRSLLRKRAAAASSAQKPLPASSSEDHGGARPK